MPDWSYHTVLRPLVPRVPRRLFRAWGDSRVGAAVVRVVADAPLPDARLGARADADTAPFVRHLGAGFTAPSGDAVADPVAAAARVHADGRVLLDVGAGGPGLPKRVHEAVTPPVTGSRRWGFVLLGLGMVIAGAAVWAVAATRVVLPYDERFVTVPHELLPFLAHDRMTLAGTMLAIGVLYAAIAWFAPGTKWARRAFGASGAFGFGNFFLFLGFGYFDPLHAAVSAALFPFFVWGLAGRPDGTAHCAAVVDRNDAAWRRAQWGTLGFVALAVGLMVGGFTIAVIGSTSVFVSSDVAFIGDVPLNERLVALTAHDRAGFGGALVSNGVVVLSAALWGVRRGAAWLWWALLVAGTVGFASTLGVHLVVGYTDALHLAPVVFGVALFTASLWALAPFLLDRAVARVDRSVSGPATRS